MVVQHNLTAMNSNRMLGVTTKAQAKTTEKLSSGYKINRAADDAAGLAISEKMRKQIRGLTQASANAQDGISAVQTAEGALTEVHDMLQRMNELAVKASNGTQSESDRASIQAEIDQLATEIDRVSETTKFNETYLLKGDKDVAKGYSYSYKAVGETGTTADKAKVATANMSTDVSTGLTAAITFASTAKAADQNAIAKALRDQGITISAEQNENDFNVKSYSVTLNGSAANAYKVNTKTGVIDEFEVVDMEGNKVADVKVNGGAGAQYAKKSSAVITAVDNGTTKAITAAQNKGDVGQFYDADGNAISANALGNYFSVLSGTGAGTVTASADDKSFVTVDGKAVVIDKNGFDSSNVGTKISETELMSYLESGGILYEDTSKTATVLLAGDAGLTSAKLGKVTATALVGTYEYVGSGGVIPNSGGKHSMDGTTKVDGWYHLETGTKLNIGALNGVSATAGDQIIVGLNGANAAAAKTNYTFTPGDGGVAAQAGKQLYDAVGNTLTMSQAASLIASNKNLTGALGLNLHVGADSTGNNQIALNIEAMSAKGLGINGIRVDGKNDSNALKSIETIKEAIQKVSAQRSALGAVQNRLEHTINNLDNVVENTTSAESAIRDTDMATTMVQYSKNNILAQAGTSMLAQANQSNQSVLSLLQ